MRDVRERTAVDTTVIFAPTVCSSRIELLMPGLIK